ncbi:hypothetical protein ACHAWF_009324 [Thalassiosira exigua]
MIPPTTNATTATTIPRCVQSHRPWIAPFMSTGVATGRTAPVSGSKTTRVSFVAGSALPSASPLGDFRDESEQVDASVATSTSLARKTSSGRAVELAATAAAIKAMPTPVDVDAVAVQAAPRPPPPLMFISPASICLWGATA